MILELNKFGKDIEKKAKRPTVIYISDAFISVIYSMILTMTCMIVTNNEILMGVSSLIGTVLGSKSFKFALNILGHNVSFLKEAIDKELKDEEKDNEEQ